MNKVVLTDTQVEELDIILFKYTSGSLNLKQTILELRAGGFYDWATLVFIIYMFSLQQVDSFQSVPLPHMDPMGWMSGKYDSRNAGNPQCLSNPPSRFERIHALRQRMKMVL